MSGGYDFHEKRGHFIADQYAGKIDRTGICNRILSKEELDKICSGEMPEKESILAYWDTSKGYTENGIGNTVFDVGPHKLDAEGFNHPVRGLTGWNWNGKNDSFRIAPNEYGGIEFHPDALTDSNWKVTNSMKIPENLNSGV